MIEDVTSLRASIDNKGDRLFALLYANSTPRISSYIAIAQAIDEVGHRAAVVVPKGTWLEPEELAGFEGVRFFVATEREMNQLEGVDVFFSSEIVSNVEPPGAVTVCIPHSIPDAGLGQRDLKHNNANFFRNNPTVIRIFDYFVSAVRQSDSEWCLDNYSFIQGVYPASFLGHRRSHLDIVPGGYPKLDYSSRILRSSGPFDTLLYSPTSSIVGSGQVRRDGESILLTLLGAFPSLRVVFRPYPYPSEVAYGRTLAERFSNHPRFEFDATTTGIASQRRSSMIVTDASSSALTFSMATKRPLVFVNLDKEGGNSVLSRTPFGYSATSRESLVAAVNDGLNNATAWTAAIEENSGRFIYNPGSAARELARNLERFARRDRAPNWLSIQRKPMPTEDAVVVRAQLDKLHAWCRLHNTENANKMYGEIEAHFQPAA
jgi:hypothetical protein